MGSYPLVGAEPVINNDLGEVSLFDTVFGDSDTFLGETAAITTYAAGTLLGRITASSKVTPYNSAGVDGSENIVGVMGSAVTTDAVPSDVFVRFIVGGQVRLDKITAYNAGTPIAPTVLEQDQMRQTGIIPLSTLELTKLDNQ